ncbi:S41 family peptidase [Salinicola rhizosphaerae]|uniref:Carboxyl-terminal protease n=1 Tax=Salinicola rhizosphaerae TaxID=1443141 RepID=A0ABQ3DTX3_9GAMM|nr:S41 family peptidase [Salinicola rhizosphaerae]GHB14524.1 carboxyl-terminal protease [Salinicola rhizosphaerae]
MPLNRPKLPLSSGKATARTRVAPLALKVLFSGLLVPGLLFIGVPNASAQTQTQAQSTDAASQDAANGLPVEDVQTFAEVFERIKRAYVEPVDDKTLLRNAMRGMLSQLDPHSEYLDADAFENLRETTEGEFSGVGIEVGLRDDQLTVIAPIDDTPAARAGIQPGDRILAIDGTPTNNLSLQEAVDLMRGDAGTELELTLLRDGEQEPRTLTLTRASIQSESVSSRLLEPGYGYLRISQFQSRTGEQTRDALTSLMQKGPLQGLVLDLRNNPGGVLSSATDVVDQFLTQGLIVYTKGRLADEDLRFSAHAAGTTAPNVPLVVLINGGSASAAEIVAGALQDQHRGVLMGTQSFGKGSVQQVLPLGNGDGLKLTTARYYTPSGRSIQAEGITPDVRVVRGRLEVEDDAGLQLRESNLRGHLLNGDPSEARQNPDTPIAADDYQLGEALNLLKALNVVKRPAGGTVAPTK